MPAPSDIMGEPDEDPSKTVYLVRHGATALNADHRMRGWDDVALNAEGRQDAETLAQAMKDVPLDRVFSSDLKRAVDTMQTIVKANVGKPAIRLMDDLRTIDVGAWTGQKLSAVESHLAKLQDQWEKDPDARAPHGESWTEFQGRQLQAWKTILAAPGTHILVVAHLRCSVWALGYALVGMKLLAGDDLRLLGRVTQSTARVSTLSYSKREGLKILGVNAQEPERG
ncbi:MAG: histidine phosphatase family protein [bacterium]